MPTINQLIRKGRNFDNLKHKEISIPRKIACVGFTNQTEYTAYVPGDGHSMRSLFYLVIERYSRDFPGVRYHKRKQSK